MDLWKEAAEVAKKMLPIVSNVLGSDVTTGKSQTIFCATNVVHLLAIIPCAD